MFAKRIRPKLEGVSSAQQLPKPISVEPPLNAPFEERTRLLLAQKKTTPFLTHMLFFRYTLSLLIFRHSTCLNVISHPPEHLQGVVVFKRTELHERIQSPTKPTAMYRLYIGSVAMLPLSMVRQRWYKETSK